MKEPPALSANFDEGQFVDAWMLVHFLSGAAGGFFNVFVALQPTTVLLVGLAMMIAWEIGEIKMGIDEARINRVLDVAVGILGTTLALWVASQLSPTEQRIAFFVTWGTALAGLGLGILNARRRKREGRAKARRTRTRKKALAK